MPVLYFLIAIYWVVSASFFLTAQEKTGLEKVDTSALTNFSMIVHHKIQPPPFATVDAVYFESYGEVLETTVKTVTE